MTHIFFAAKEGQLSQIFCNCMSVYLAITGTYGGHVPYYSGRSIVVSNRRENTSIEDATPLMVPRGHSKMADSLQFNT